MLEVKSLLVALVLYMLYHYRSRMHRTEAKEVNNKCGIKPRLCLPNSRRVTVREGSHGIPSGRKYQSTKMTRWVK